MAMQNETDHEYWAINSMGKVYNQGTLEELLRHIDDFAIGNEVHILKVDRAVMLSGSIESEYHEDAICDFVTQHIESNEGTRCVKIEATNLSHHEFMNLKGDVNDAVQNWVNGISWEGDDAELEEAHVDIDEIEPLKGLSFLDRVLFLDAYCDFVNNGQYLVVDLDEHRI